MTTEKKSEIFTVKELRQALRGVRGSVEVQFMEGFRLGEMTKGHRVDYAEMTKQSYTGDKFFPVFVLYGKSPREENLRRAREFAERNKGEGSRTPRDLGVGK
jgi:hypothetical protein